MSDPVRVEVPGSKSVTHRAFLLAALCPKGAVVRRPLLSGDALSTLSVLRQLGAQWRIDGDSVRFSPSHLTATDETLDCGNSGTSLRLFSGLCATMQGSSTLDGDASLRSRPNGAMLEALQVLGARTGSQQGRPPLVIEGPIGAGKARFGPRVSSQFISAVALAATRLRGQTTIEAAAPVASRPYLDITVDVAAAFGVQIALVDDAPLPGWLTLQVEGLQSPSAREGTYAVPGDWSAAAFPLVASCALGVPVQLPGLDLGAAQGDKAILQVLQQVGAEVRAEGEGVVCIPRKPRFSGRSAGSPLRVDVGQTPDMFPALCALAAVGHGAAQIDGAPSLRHKECDRIVAMVQGLTTLGVRCEELPDGAIVHGGRIGGGEVHSYHDHRVHMALSILAAVAEQEVTVDHPECVAVSYPGFHRDLAAIVAARESA